MKIFGLSLVVVIVIFNCSPVLADHTRSHISAENMNVSGSPLYKPRAYVAGGSGSWIQDMVPGTPYTWVVNTNTDIEYDMAITFGNDYVAGPQDVYSCSVGFSSYSVYKENFHDWGARIDWCRNSKVTCEGPGAGRLEFQVSTTKDHRNCYFHLQIRKK